MFTTVHRVLMRSVVVGYAIAQWYIIVLVAVILVVVMIAVFVAVHVICCAGFAGLVTGLFGQVAGYEEHDGQDESAPGGCTRQIEAPAVFVQFVIVRSLDSHYNDSCSTI
jgi:hypothetical protein